METLSLCLSSPFFSRWQPQRQFLYDFVTHSQPKLVHMSASHLSSIIWAFARSVATIWRG